VYLEETWLQTSWCNAWCTLSYVENSVKQPQQNTHDT